MWACPYSYFINISIVFTDGYSTIIRQNWRIAITDKTPDLYAVWSLNEGTGYVAADMKKSQHLYMMYYDNKPFMGDSVKFLASLQ
jgi:hypothetical protein